MLGGNDMTNPSSPEKEQLQAAMACTRDVPNAPPSAKQDCSDVVNISIFFDGTGNNKDADTAHQKWSNVARMYEAMFLTATVKNATYPIYITGVGTPFNPQALRPNEVVGQSLGERAVGAGTGLSADRRIEFGADQLNDTLKNVLLSNAKKLNDTTKAYAQQNQDKGFSDLSKALGGHRLIKQINLSVFGFSRGAAMARAFSNAFLKACKTDKSGKLTYNGHPVRIHFMGIFDTVASFGLPAANLDLPWQEKNLLVDRRVERCVHHVAAHELRFSFPVDLIQKNGHLADSWLEKVYPGVHSDVGGGYGPQNMDPGSQGISNNYARIPMRDMMAEATKHGVRMPSYAGLAADKTVAALFRERFEIQPETQTAYNAYMAGVRQTGSIKEQVQSHMEQLYACYGTYHRAGKALTVEARRRFAYMGGRGIAWEAHQFEAAERAGVVGVLFHFPSTQYRQWVKPESWRLQAWRNTATANTTNFIAHYVHDSKVDFLSNAEPFSYFAWRGINESTRNILAPWYDKAVQAVEATVKVYQKAEGIVVEKWHEGKLLATKTYKVGEKFAIDAYHAGKKMTIETYTEGKQVVLETVDAGQQYVVSSYKSVKETVSEAGQTVADKTKEAAQVAETKAKQAAQRAQDLLKDGVKEVQDAWDATRAKLGF